MYTAWHILASMGHVVVLDMIVTGITAGEEAAGLHAAHGQRCGNKIVEELIY